MVEMNSTSNSVVIRKMEEKDISSIIKINEQLSSQSRPAMWKSEVQHYLSRPKSICLVAEIEEHVVGFMMATIHPLLFGVENGGWIEILGVNPAHTAKGVGKMLGERLLEDFKSRGIKIVHTTVDWTSSDLLEFFKTLGMTKSGFITLMKEL